MSDTEFATAGTRSNRRLAAILAADVVGYSRMMAKDETGTLTALKRHRELLFDPTVAAHNGRIVKLIGDGTLVEFSSVVDAVRCALAIQMAGHPPAAGDLSIVLRIGVNLGDIIIDGDDIYGDGVNVAARLEPLAEPGGVCIASIVRESIGSRVEAPFRDGGEVTVKNMDRPIRIWRWKPGGEPASVRAEVQRVRTANETPSIAVLPFANMSGDPEQEYFSDGITEDVITDLSKVGGLAVIARNSTFVYKGRNVDIRAVGRELGVKSVLEGSIRRAGNRVRITAQLIDAGTGAHLWAERYDRDLTDIFAVQDEVTREIVAALKVTLTPREKARLREGSGTTNVEAHDLFLRARDLMFQPRKTRELFERGQTVLRQAIVLDPDYADAYAALGLVLSLDFHNRWTENADNALADALTFADRAIALEPDNPFPHYVAGTVAAFARDPERAAREIETTLRLSPNYAYALHGRGALNIYQGEPQRALADIEQAIRLDPGFSQQYLHFLGLAHFMLGHYEAAAVHFRERIVLVPGTDLSRGMLVATLGYLDAKDEAARVWSDLMLINPKYSFSEHVARLPFKNAADVERLRAGFARSGVAEAKR